MNYYDALAKDLRLALAHCAEQQPPLIIASCVCGKTDGEWDYLLAIHIPMLSTVAKWQSEPQEEVTELFAECRNQSLIPSVMMQFFVPACVIEKNGIRSAVDCCIEHIEAAMSGKIPTDDSILGVPQYRICLMISE